MIRFERQLLNEYNKTIEQGRYNPVAGETGIVVRSLEIGQRGALDSKLKTQNSKQPTL
jgi:hypothetical protein